MIFILKLSWVICGDFLVYIEDYFSNQAWLLDFKECQFRIFILDCRILHSNINRINQSITNSLRMSTTLSGMRLANIFDQSIYTILSELSSMISTNFFNKDDTASDLDHLTLGNEILTRLMRRSVAKWF